MQQDSQNQLRVLPEVIRDMDIWNLTFDIFSPCSGLIVSGFSKRPKGQHIEKLKTYLDQVITPYKKFKRMYAVDNTTVEFTGQKGKARIF